MTPRQDSCPQYEPDPRVRVTGSRSRGRSGVVNQTLFETFRPDTRVIEVVVGDTLESKGSERTELKNWIFYSFLNRC